MVTRDILFITLSVCAVTFTAMAVWCFVYLLKVMRGLAGLVEDFRDRLHAIDDILRTIKDKLTDTHVQLSFVAQGIKQLISYVISRRSKRRASTRASSVGEDS